MGRPALAAPHHLSSGAAARRYHRHVLALGAARTRRRSPVSAGPRINACSRRCRRTSRHPPESPIPNCGSGSPPREESGRLVIGHFGSIYPGKQPNALLDICAILKQRGLKAADRLYRIVHPRRRQGRGRVSRARRRTRHRRRRHRQRLCRIRSRGVRTVRRDRRLLLSARGGPHGAARRAFSPACSPAGP